MDYYNDWSIYGDIEDTEKQDDSSKKQSKQAKRTAKRGTEASAFRKDLSTEEMFDLHKKGYSYYRIAKELKCSPSTVRNRLNDKELLKSLWLI